MHALAFILAIAAALVFVLAAIGHASSRVSLIPTGLALLTIAWIVQLTMETTDPVTL